MRHVLWLMLLVNSLLLVACKTAPVDDSTISQSVTKPDRRTPDIIASDRSIELAAMEELADNQELISRSHINVHAYTAWRY